MASPAVPSIPTAVKYALVQRGLRLPRPPSESKSNKKNKKQKKQKKKGQGQQVAERKAPVLTTLQDGQFGDMLCIQSRFKTGRTLTPVSALTPSMAGQRVWVRGRVYISRGKGKSCFMVLRRGFSTVQCCLFANPPAIPRDMVKYAQRVPVESVVDVFAQVAEVKEATNTTQSQVELQVERIYGISIATAHPPFQMQDAMRPERQDLDDDQIATMAEEEAKRGVVRVNRTVRLDNRCLDLRTPANHAIFRLQSAVCRYFRQYFIERDFVEIHTPKITPGVSEGGSEVFRLKYFNNDACLAQSPQLFKQMASVCADLYKVFEIGPVFRAEYSNTHRHLCEFVGLDFEMEIVEHYHEVLKVLGDLFVYIFDHLNANHRAEMEAVWAQYNAPPLQYSKDTLVLTFKEAVAMLREAGETIGDYDDFTTPQEKKLGTLVKARFNTDFYIVDQYPLAARPFYTMPSPEDPLYTNSYDVFLRGEEITSGAQRIHEVPLLKERALACEIPLDNIQSYTDSFSLGVPPHGGAGIGLERVVMLFLGLNNIRKTSMFPRTPQRVSP